MDPFHNWPSDGTGPWGRVGGRVDPGKGLRSAKVDSTSAPSAIVGKQELRQLINRPRRGFLASHLNRMELGRLIIAKMLVWVPGRVSCWFKRKRGRRWTETEATFTLHLPLYLLHLLPPTPPCHTDVEGKKLDLSCFQRIPFSRPHSPEDPGGPGADRERQRVREEDQHRHREDLHPSRVQLLCRWCQRPRCLPGEIITHLTFDQISSLDIFQNL